MSLLGVTGQYRCQIPAEDIACTRGVDRGHDTSRLSSRLRDLSG
jgi:hypothetical protein